MCLSNDKVRHRNFIRLKDYDYSQSGAYFVTIATYRRRMILGKIQDGRIELNQLGGIAQICWEEIPLHFNNVCVDESVIMPNHVHGIILICFEGSACRAPTNSSEIAKRSSLGTIIRSFKSAVTRKTHALGYKSDGLLWQRNYYEHVVRNNDDLNQIRQYILDNPARWLYDTENPEFGHKTSK